MNHSVKQVARDYLAKYQTRPDQWAADILDVELWSKQREILQSVFHNRRTVVRSCHSAGKTFVAAVAALAFMFLKPPCKIITTAPTWYQVKDLLWSEIGTLFKNCLKSAGFPGTLQTTRLNLDSDWFATGISPKEAVNFQGFHQRHILIIFDEAPGVRPDIIAGADSLMSSGDAHCLWIGNPTEASGHFYEAFRSPAWEKFHIGYQDTPNFSGESAPESVARELLSPQWVEEVREEWGEDSALFISRVKGDFPPAGENQLIPLSLCEEAANRDVAAPGSDEKIMGLDIARFGSDQTVYMLRQGPVILPRVETDAKRDTMVVTGHAKRIAIEEEVAQINADVVGLGAGVIDRLKEQKIKIGDRSLRIIPVNGGERANDPDKFFNRRAEMWFNTRDWLMTGKIPRHDRLFRDLTAPRFKYTSKGQYQLESKDDIKKRLGASPDYGDAAVNATQNIRPRSYVRFLS